MAEIKEITVKVMTIHPLKVCVTLVYAVDTMILYELIMYGT